MFRNDTSLASASSLRSAPPARGPHPPLTPRTKFGRPRKVDDAAATKARDLREKGINATDIAKTLGVCRASLYRYFANDEPPPDCVTTYSDRVPPEECTVKQGALRQWWLGLSRAGLYASQQRAGIGGRLGFVAKDQLREGLDET
jgi:hypothetical protein